MAQFLWIPWRLPKLNELLDARGSIYTPKGGRVKPGATRKHTKAMPNGYSVMKKEWTSLLAMHMRTRGFSVLPGCWDFTYLFVEPNAKFDPSNISAAAIKFIEDALVKDGRMEGDGWATVHSITSHFTNYTDAVPGVLLAVHGSPVSRAEMCKQAETMSNAERFHRRQRTYASISADNADQRAAQRGSLPGSNQPVGEAPASEPKTSGPRVRAKRAATNGGGSAANGSGK